MRSGFQVCRMSPLSLLEGPFVLKYQDKEGSNVTLTCRADVQVYLSELVAQFQKQSAGGLNGPKLNSQLPPMRIQVCKVASEVS